MKNQNDNVELEEEEVKQLEESSTKSKAAAAEQETAKKPVCSPTAYQFIEIDDIMERPGSRWL